VTALLALGCESAGREAGDEAPALENPGRTEEGFGGISTPQRNRAKLDQKCWLRVRAGESNFTR